MEGLIFGILLYFDIIRVLCHRLFLNTLNEIFGSMFLGGTSSLNVSV